jgi:hypothetical protein
MTNINWKYFFGGAGGNTFDRYYKAKINGITVEKHASNTGVRYSIGNMHEAKKKYKTEEELLDALTLNKIDNDKPQQNEVDKSK